MIEPKTHFSYAPRGPGIMLALFYFERGDDVYGWYTGSSGGEFPQRYFMLEDYYSTDEPTFYRSAEDDPSGAWLRMRKYAATQIDPSPLPPECCHELDRMQDAFVREWLFFADDPQSSHDAQTYSGRELGVQPVNIRPAKLNKLNTAGAVWTYASPECDLGVVGYLTRHAALDCSETE